MMSARNRWVSLKIPDQVWNDAIPNSSQQPYNKNSIKVTYNNTVQLLGGNGNVNTGSGGGGAGSTSPGRAGGNGGSGIVILRCAKATATLGSGITVNSTAGPGSVNGVAISGTSDYYYSATSGTGTITF